MTDMADFERQVAGEMVGRAGPVRPVDDLAIYESVTAASRSSRWRFTMFSALKFVAAGAVVALFGGMLLSGVLTTPQTDEVVPAATLPTDSIAPGGDPALVTGIGDCIGEYVRSVDGPGWQFNHVTGGTCSLETDDPRLTGAMTVEFQAAWFDGSHPNPDERGGFYWAAIEVTGPDGSWVGSMTGVDDITEWRASGERQQILMTLEGTGAYEGQTFLGHLAGHLTDPEMSVNGLIYGGPPPPWEIPG